MPRCDTIIANASVVDGSGNAAVQTSVALQNDRILEVGNLDGYSAENIVDAKGLVLAPGFIDVHTHDDIAVLRTPEMLPKLSQGVTTVIVGNCGVSAAPVHLRGDPPEPMNLLGRADDFRFPTFGDYARAVDAANTAVNVAALVGHTSLRATHVQRLDREATTTEIESMRAQLAESLAQGAIGLSTGLAYRNAFSSSPREVESLAAPLRAAGAVYTTHMRSEGEDIESAIHEALQVGKYCETAIVISHLKCAGVDNWGRSEEVLATLDTARSSQTVWWDCYPYTAGSTVLDLRQVDERVRIDITWSEPHPEMAGQTLGQIAKSWQIDQLEAARRLQPAGAIYHMISEQDMRRILRHPATMIGSDGLPNDPRPHPRLWGTFPRVLGKYCRDEGLFPLVEAIHKMTGMPARRFGLNDRGFVRAGYFADLVLFSAANIRDTATFEKPISPADGIETVWVNGAVAYCNRAATGARTGRFLPRQSTREPIAS
jgi:N-acyl-D-aspartate/D-glutamate deacylase